MLLSIVVITLFSMVFMLLGSNRVPDPGAASLVLAYGMGLGLFCTLGLCTTRAWLNRLEMRKSWILAWLVAVISAVAFSYVAAVIGTVLGFGPGPSLLVPFMLKSVLAVALVAAALLRYLYIRLQWEAETLAEAEARVQALQARIQPHFLFNSLNTIASLTQENPDAAERATEDLADLFRAGMRRADQTISMGEELRLARKYLEMEQRRLGERLEVDWQAAELPEAASVLPMMLQPLLENAVNHGVQPRVRGGTVRLFGREEGKNIVITVTNPLAEGDTQHGHGMALRNIRSRLDLAFGNRASLVTYQDEENYYAVLKLPYVELTDN
jgi:two-component system sensor histidine kinase AlgZ